MNLLKLYDNSMIIPVQNIVNIVPYDEEIIKEIELRKEKDAVFDTTEYEADEPRTVIFTPISIIITGESFDDIYSEWNRLKEMEGSK